MMPPRGSNQALSCLDGTTQRIEGIMVSPSGFFMRSARAACHDVVPQMRIRADNRVAQGSPGYREDRVPTCGPSSSITAYTVESVLTANHTPPSGQDSAALDTAVSGAKLADHSGVPLCQTRATWPWLKRVVRVANIPIRSRSRRLGRRHAPVRACPRVCIDPIDCPIYRPLAARCPGRAASEQPAGSPPAASRRALSQCNTRRQCSAPESAAESLRIILATNGRTGGRTSPPAGLRSAGTSMSEQPESGWIDGGALQCSTDFEHLGQSCQQTIYRDSYYN